MSWVASEITGGNFNGHAGELSAGFAGACEGNSHGVIKHDGLQILDFCHQACSC